MTLGAASTASSFGFYWQPLSIGSSNEFSGWENLNNAHFPQANYGGEFPGTEPWFIPIDPNVTGSVLNSSFTKVGGNGYTATDGIYTPFGGGEFQVSSTSVVSGLETVIFQIDIGDGDVPFNAIPTLSFNGGTQQLAAAYSMISPGSFVFVNLNDPGPPMISSNHSFQWDLSSLGPITSYTIDWATGNHTQVYGMQTHTGDSFTGFAIPEPSGEVLVGFTFLGLAFHRKRSR